jgi:hypothetical protein
MKCQGVTAHKQISNSGGVERGKQISEVGIGRHRSPAIRSIPGSGPTEAQGADPPEPTARMHGQTTRHPRGEESISCSPRLCVRVRSHLCFIPEIPRSEAFESVLSGEIGSGRTLFVRSPGLR